MKNEGKKNQMMKGVAIFIKSVAVGALYQLLVTIAAGAFFVIKRNWNAKKRQKNSESVRHDPSECENCNCGNSDDCEPEDDEYIRIYAREIVENVFKSNKWQSLPEVKMLEEHGFDVSAIHYSLTHEGDDDTITNFSKIAEELVRFNPKTAAFGYSEVFKSIPFGIIPPDVVLEFVKKKAECVRYIPDYFIKAYWNYILRSSIQNRSFIYTFDEKEHPLYWLSGELQTEERIEAAIQIELDYRSNLSDIVRIRNIIDLVIDPDMKKRFSEKYLVIESEAEE